MIHENQIPVLGNVNNLQSLQLTPEEVFILSRINGSLTIKQIVQIVGFPMEKVVACLEKLSAQSVVTFKGGSEPRKKIKQEGPATIIQILDEEDQDPVLSKIPRSFRNRIQLIYDKLIEMNYFEVLELPPSASSDDVQSSYLKLVKIFHPDQLRGKEAGHYKLKLEKIFQKIHEAAQKLRNDQQRAAYIHSLMEARLTSKEKRPDEMKAKYEHGLPRKDSNLHFAGADSQYNMGMTEEKKGNLQAALNFYQMALNLSPQSKTFEQAYLRVRKLIREGY